VDHKNKREILDHLGRAWAAVHGESRPKELPAFFVEVKKDRGAGDGALCGLNVEARLAVAHPAPGLVFTRLAGDDLDAVVDHASDRVAQENFYLFGR
jgi:hypothetical protein